eukprot:TRINITY_DN70961_c0_g1_i1.p1 TRINITY_DN70961_c0_g1~~TRINITY_DN70961_c0_g1_i1.p1  ORF type:complete len:351 (+),score=171.02 TRINITY_DN70961_c0_g1_i1:122-1054(+)
MAALMADRSQDMEEDDPMARLCALYSAQQSATQQPRSTQRPAENAEQLVAQIESLEQEDAKVTRALAGLRSQLAHKRRVVEQQTDVLGEWGSLRDQQESALSSEKTTTAQARQLAAIYRRLEEECMQERLSLARRLRIAEEELAASRSFHGACVARMRGEVQAVCTQLADATAAGRRLRDVQQRIGELEVQLETDPEAPDTTDDTPVEDLPNHVGTLREMEADLQRRARAAEAEEQAAAGELRRLQEQRQQLDSAAMPPQQPFLRIELTEGTVDEELEASWGEACSAARRLENLGEQRRQLEASKRRLQQ